MIAMKRARVDLSVGTQYTWVYRTPIYIWEYYDYYYTYMVCVDQQTSDWWFQ